MHTPAPRLLSDEAPVWFITGCSTGFGQELARQAIALGYRTVVTARDPAKLDDFEDSEKVLVLKLDVTRPDQVAAAIEEGEAAEVLRMFEVNVFGLTAMIQAALPGMRKRRSGCIVNLSSLAGIRGMPALGQYNATKFAVEGLSEALRREVEPLGIQVMVVEPSGFRTDWAGRSANESALQIDDYQATAGAVRGAIRESSGKQPGDPVRAVKAIVAAVASGQPPHHLLLGNDAFDGAMAKVDELRSDFMAGEAVARGADFPEQTA